MSIPRTRRYPRRPIVKRYATGGIVKHPSVLVCEGIPSDLGTPLGWESWDIKIDASGVPAVLAKIRKRMEAE